MKRLLLALIICLLVSKVAGAQSAWVLWECRAGGEFKEWNIIRVYPVFQECRKARDSWFELSPSGENFEEIIKGSPSVLNPNCPDCLWVFTSKEDGEKYLAFTKNGTETIVMAPNMIVEGSPGKGFRVIRYECFPDTIDPRK